MGIYGILAASTLIIAQSGISDLSSFEPPALRDADDQIVDVLSVADGENRKLGEFLRADGHETYVMIRADGSGDGREIECRRDSDRCLAIVHRDGTADLWRIRSVSCDSTTPEAGAPPWDGEPQIRRIVRGADCFEDLRVTADGAPR